MVKFAANESSSNIHSDRKKQIWTNGLRSHIYVIEIHV